MTRQEVGRRTFWFSDWWMSEETEYWGPKGERERDCASSRSQELQKECPAEATRRPREALIEILEITSRLEGGPLHQQCIYFFQYRSCMVQSRKWLLQRAFCKIHLCLLVDKTSCLRQRKSDASIYTLDSQKVPKYPTPHPVSLRWEARMKSWVATWENVFSSALVEDFTSESSYGFPWKGCFSPQVVRVQSACPHGNTSPF